MVREAAVAGQFYPGDAHSLSGMIDEFLSRAKKSDYTGEILGLVSPHAGYVFSGQTAASVFKQLTGKKIDTVILIGSSHNYRIKDAAVWSGGDFSTPLGNVHIDEDIVKIITAGNTGIKINNEPHYPEHSLEVQIPFLQKVLGNFKLVPILINDMEFSDDLANILFKSVQGKKVVFVASTDMTHYPDKKNAEIVDNDILKAIEKFDTAELIKRDAKWLSQGIPNLHCTLCGLPAVVSVMKVCKMLGCDSAKIISYSNSAASEYGDEKRVVGYGGVAFIKTGKKTDIKNENISKKEFALTKESQIELLSIARESITRYLETGKQYKFGTKNKEIQQDGAVFVTLEKNHNLRGCIGTTEARMPIYEAVSQLALAAAFEDTRFLPVTKSEMKDIEIEISVLSPIKKISSADEIIEGKHGVVVKKGFRSGLFLPQVWEHPQLAKKEDFMSELCYQKAGLPRDAWKKGDVDIYIFTVFAFKEK
ncbi:MAG: hypothetical protein BWY26_01043 [Elusimicrobia bacterium ADurb.Bin231]|nr:MAG: hypothetical protein BWY26_01043 [Elusimicrobia bacterium ADurb.Bin231]